MTGYPAVFNQKLSRILMEDKLGRELTLDEVVHHIDGDDTNDSIENLQVMSRSDHISLHHTRWTPSDGTRERMSKSHLGKTHTVSDEARQKISKAKLGNQYGLGHTYTPSEECNKRNSETHIGKTHSEETRERISKGIKEGWYASHPPTSWRGGKKKCEV